MDFPFRYIIVIKFMLKQID